MNDNRNYAIAAFALAAASGGCAFAAASTRELFLWIPAALFGMMTAGVAVSWARRK